MFVLEPLTTPAGYYAYLVGIAYNVDHVRQFSHCEGLLSLSAGLGYYRKSLKSIKQGKLQTTLDEERTSYRSLAGLQETLTGEWGWGPRLG